MISEFSNTTPQGILETVNNAFVAETRATREELGFGKLSIYSYISDDVEFDNVIRQVFIGKTRFLEGLRNPLSGFSE